MAAIAAELGEVSSSSSSPRLPPPPSNFSKGKPVVVRVKRKVTQAMLDAFWLEINERPSKKPLLDIGNLSISGSDTGKVLEESGKKKLFLQHLETVNRSEAIKDVLHSFLQLDSSGSKELKRKIEERRSMPKHEKQKQDQRRAIARKKHEDLVRNARFEQIWKNRMESMEIEEGSLGKICQLYDVVRVDAEDETHKKEQKTDVAAVDDSAILCNYLPLLRELLPSAAEEIEHDLIEAREEKYVYDLYTVDDGLYTNMGDVADYPLVQVDNDDDYYAGPIQSEFESDDSNAEDNPHNDYPDEESSGHEDDDDKDPFYDLEGSESQYENEEAESSEDDQDWRWEHR